VGDNPARVVAAYRELPYVSVGSRFGTHRWERCVLVADDGDRFNVNACASEDDKTGTSTSAVRQNRAPFEEIEVDVNVGSPQVGGSLGPTHGMSDVLGVDHNSFGPLALSRVVVTTDRSSEIGYWYSCDVCQTGAFPGCPPTNRRHSSPKDSQKHPDIRRTRSRSLTNQKKHTRYPPDTFRYLTRRP
jgi:hypothetical protein